MDVTPICQIKCPKNCWGQRKPVKIVTNYLVDISRSFGYGTPQSSDCISLWMFYYLLCRCTIPGSPQQGASITRLPWPSSTILCNIKYSLVWFQHLGFRKNFQKTSWTYSVTGRLFNVDNSFRVSSTAIYLKEPGAPTERDVYCPFNLCLRSDGQPEMIQPHAFWICAVPVCSLAQLTEPVVPQPYARKCRWSYSHCH